MMFLLLFVDGCASVCIAKLIEEKNVLELSIIKLVLKNNVNLNFIKD